MASIPGSDSPFTQLDTALTL